MRVTDSFITASWYAVYAFLKSSLLFLLHIMADTIITNSPDKNDNSEAGWMLALVLVVVLIAGGIILYERGFFSRTMAPSSTNINVTVPPPTVPAPTTPAPTPVINNSPSYNLNAEEL